MENKDLELYLKAKELYYTGNSIMLDSEFDDLENKLKKQGLIDTVGYTPLNNKIKHPTKMLSLDKIQINNEKDNEFQSVLEWIEKRVNPNVEIEFQPKFDGISVNCIYNGKGELTEILTRGNGTEGISLYNKLKSKVPNKLFNPEGKENMEIRGEALIERNIFINKYKNIGFMNPRNLVAGVLNRKNDFNDVLNDISIVLYEQKLNNWWMFNIEQYKDFSIKETNITLNKLKDIYYKFKEYRKNCKYQLDGIVIKINNNNIRKELGETSHHPEWAVAIKFPANTVEAIVKDIEWHVKKTGELNPIAILEPVELDGTIVQRANACNAQYCLDKGIARGSKVLIRKAGEIIPQIYGIIESKNATLENIIPQKCPICGSEIDYSNALHIKCTNSNCQGIEFEKFLSSINCFKVEYLGEALVKKLFDKGMRNGYEILYTKIEDFLNETSVNLKKVQKQLDSIKEIELKQLILSLQIKDSGSVTSEILAKLYSNIEYSDKGIQKSVIEDFKNNYIDKLNDIIKKLNENNIIVKLPEIKQNNENEIKCCLTGSPKNLGWKTKEEFMKDASKLGYIDGKLDKECKVLFTDDLNSNSSKMTKAKKLNIKIMLYSDIQK